MTGIRVSTDSVAEVVDLCAALVRETDAGIDGIRRASGDLSESWKDEHSRHFCAMLDAFIVGLRRELATVEAFQEHLRCFLAKLEELAPGGNVRSHPAAAGGHGTGAGAAVVAAAAMGAYQRLATLKSFVLPSHAKRFFVLDPRRFQRTEFEWGTNDPAMTFGQISRHGLRPKDYRNLLRQCGMIIEAGMAGTGPDDALRAAWRVFISNDPIRLDRAADGTIDIIDGRYRLWAAFELGQPVPVQLNSRPTA